MMRTVSVHPFDARVEVVDTPLGRVLVCRPLAEIAAHLFTTRDANFRPTDPGSPRAWQQLAHILGVAPERLARVFQVHGHGVVPVEAGGAVPGGEHPPEADALVTDDPSAAVSVRVADCVPILIADRRQHVVAAVHAGWRGTCASIAAATVDALCARYASRPADLVAAIGPSAGPDRFEVGDEVVEAFRDAGHDAGGPVAVVRARAWAKAPRRLVEGQRRPVDRRRRARRVGRGHARLHARASRLVLLASRRRARYRTHGGGHSTARIMMRAWSRRR